MATDVRHSRRKHQRSSSPEEVERHSKRHKHRHHPHPRGSIKREEERERDGEIVAAVLSSPPAPNFDANNHFPGYDVEEGEILEEEGFGGRDGEIGKKETQSDAESGEIKVIGDRDVRSDNTNLELFTEESWVHRETVASFKGSEGINAKISKTGSEDISNNKFNSLALDGEKGTCCQSRVIHMIHEDYVSPIRSSAEPQDGKNTGASAHDLRNGYLDSISSKEDKRQRGVLGCFIGNEKLKDNYDEEGLDVDEGKVSIHWNSYSDTGGEKYRTSGTSPSHGRYRSRSRSSDHTRDRSCSHSIMEEYAHSKSRHSGEQGALSCAARHKAEYDLSEERIVECSRKHGHGNRGLAVDDRREYGTSYHSGEARSGDRSKDRDMGWDLRRDKEQERSWNRDDDKVHRKEKEYERSHKRDRREGEKNRSRGREVDRDRRKEKERDRSWERVVERDRRRKKERDWSRDRTRGSERDRDWESEQDVKNPGRDKLEDMDWERPRDRNRHKDRAIVNGKDKHMVHEDGHDSRDRYRHSRHSRHEETECHKERIRNVELAKVRKSMGNSFEGGQNTVERGEDEQDDLDEKVTLLLAEQEEEDLNRVKEESRRRREAILEKYKKKQQQVEQMPENEEKGKESVDIPAPNLDASDGKNDGVSVLDVETSFSVEKPPQENGNAASENISVAGGLGGGSPKSERSDDKFCDDIFGETPTGVQKLGKGDALQIERDGLHDNWDDAEGYYNYRVGEILDGRYEVTASHGRGVFSTVVRARNLKAGIGEPEEVAIKIIRNNDTMYKAGMDELVILKKLVGADPDDKRHCVRFFSSFKYRNHLCLVFESLNMNLREVLKKFGRNIGLRLTAVRAYAKQLFIALKHLRNCGVLHCDIKPDNMLVNEAKNVLKLCDFGSAMFAGKNEVTPYLVSRFYRAPEIILGLPYDHPLDMWSIGCCLYELYIGKALFPGPTNNDMLRLHMELKGPFPKKMLRKGEFIEPHFDHDLNFLSTEEDLVTKKILKKMIVNIKPRDIGTIITGSPGEDPKMLANFKDLLEKVFVLDPDKRLTVSQALSHPFITGK